MTPDEIAELERLCEKATPGPWAVNPVNAQVDAFDSGVPLPVCQLLWPTEERTEAETEANAEFIAASREAVPKLIAALKEARAECGRLTRDFADKALALDMCAERSKRAAAAEARVKDREAAVALVIAALKARGEP